MNVTGLFEMLPLDFESLRLEQFILCDLYYVSIVSA
jgi:hypothetical protein